MSETKTPQQKRASLTRTKLILAGLKVISEKGYHNVTLDDIAASASLSTGIAYRYFKNKKELLLNAISYSYENIRSMAGMEHVRLEDYPSLRALLLDSLDKFLEMHVKYHGMHEELEGLCHQDSDVRNLYDFIKKDAMEKLMIQISGGNPAPLLKEKLYISLDVMESFCHQAVVWKEEGMDISFYKDKAIEIVLSLMEAEDGR